MPRSRTEVTRHRPVPRLSPDTSLRSGEYFDGDFQQVPEDLLEVVSIALDQSPVLIRRRNVEHAVAHGRVMTLHDVANERPTAIGSRRMSILPVSILETSRSSRMRRAIRSI